MNGAMVPTPSFKADKSDAEMPKLSDGLAEDTSVPRSKFHDLVPNLDQIERHLGSLGKIIMAEEILLFERSSFEVVSSWTSEVGKQNPNTDRFERLPNIVKKLKQSISRYTFTLKSAEQFSLMELKMSTFSMFIIKFTTNTYLLVVLPPGEERFNCAMENCRIARKEFEDLMQLRMAL